MSYLLGIICRWRGHKWSKAYSTDPFARDMQGIEFPGIPWAKCCRRCGAQAPVKRRAKRAKEPA